MTTLYWSQVGMHNAALVQMRQAFGHVLNLVRPSLAIDTLLLA